MTGVVGRARPRWLIAIAPGDIHLVCSEAELRELLRQRPTAGEAQVYEVGAGPRALRNVPELARLLPEVTDSEPPIRGRHLRVETRSPDRVKLSEELAVLNRPLETEIEYYDATPRSRAKPVFAALLVLAALAGAGYLVFARGRRADDNVITRPARQGEQASARTAAVPAANAASSTSGTSGGAEPEGDPPVSSVAGQRAARSGTTSPPPSPAGNL